MIRENEWSDLGGVALLGLAHRLVDQNQRDPVLPKRISHGLEQAHGAEHPGLIDQEQHAVRNRTFGLVDGVEQRADDDASDARMLLGSVPRSIEMNTSICPVRRSWALKLLPETRPHTGRI